MISSLAVLAAIVLLVWITWPRCPRCDVRCRVRRRTVQVATYGSTGRGVETRSCRRCGWFTTSSYTIARKVRPAAPRAGRSR